MEQLGRQAQMDSILSHQNRDQRIWQNFTFTYCKRTTFFNQAAHRSWDEPDQRHARYGRTFLIYLWIYEEICTLEPIYFKWIFRWSSHRVNFCLIFPKDTDWATYHLASRCCDSALHWRRLTETLCFILPIGSRMMFLIRQFWWLISLWLIFYKIANDLPDILI